MAKNKLNIDFSQLGEQALIKKVEVRDDAEIVTMRDFADLKHAASVLGSQMNCSEQRAVMANIFSFGVRAQRYTCGGCGSGSCMGCHAHRFNNGPTKGNG